MKFGIVLPIWRLSVAEAETLAQEAEGLGLDAVLVPDHIIVSQPVVEAYGANWPDPFSLLAYLAGRTSRIQLGTSVIILPYRNPLAQAKAAATVDQVSGGRFIFGVGVGWAEGEFQALGAPFAQRGPMSDEYIRIIKGAWASDVPTFQGKYYSFSGLTFLPRPVQQPGPPIWVGGNSTPAMRRAASLGDAWHPIGLSLNDFEKGAAFVRQTAALASRREGPQLAPRNLLNLAGGAGGSGRAAFEGSAAEVAADIRRAQAIGAAYLVFDLPPLDVPGMARLMERFVKEVKPAVA